MSDWTISQPPAPESALLFKLQRQKWLAASCAALLFVVLAIGIQLLPPSYSSSALVIVDSQTPRPAIAGVSPAAPLPIPFNQEIVGTEMAVIHSHQLMAEVADRLHLIDDPHFNPDLRPGLIGQWKQAFAAWASQHLPFLPATQAADSNRARSDTVATLTRDVTVKSVPESRVIEITASAWNNKLAAAISNTVANLYVSTRVQLAHSLNGDAQDYLTKRLSELMNASTAASQQVERYRAEHGLALGATSTLLQEQITDLSRQLLAAQGRLSATQAAYDNARTSNPEQLSSVLNSQTMTRLRELEAAASTKRANLIATYGPNSPILRPLNGELHNLHAQISAEANRWVSGLAEQVRAETADVTALSKRAAEVRQQVQGMEEAEAHLDTLKARSAAALSLYTTFLSRAKETDVDLLFPATDVRVVSPAAVPSHPSFPRNIFMLPAAALLSLGFGTLLGLTVESRRKGLVSSQDVDSLLQVPTLAMVPLRTSRTERAYRDEIERLLNCMHFGFRARSILITSALPQEGKSVTARALADAAVARGWRVLLIDADMRSVVRTPKTRATTVGLAEVLRGELDVVQAMRRDSGSQLITLPAGRERDNPVRLLSLQPAQNVIESLTDRFDLVVVDGPPVMAGGDCWMLSQHVDQTIMVAAWGETSPVALRTAIKHLRLPRRQGGGDTAPTTIAGILLNKVDPQKLQRLNQSDAIQFSPEMFRYHAAQ